MLLKDTINIAFRAIARNASRSLLTMLGIIIGVGSVVLMTSLGKSVEGLILGQVSSLGAQSMIIIPGRAENGGARGAGIDSLTIDDMAAIERLGTVETIAPIITVNSTVTHGRDESTPMVFGVVGNYFKNQSITVDHGRLIDDADVQGSNEVAILGPDVVKDLFGDLDAVGQRVQIQGRSFTVIGIQKSLGSQFFQNADKRVYIPFSVAKDMTQQSFVNFVTLTAKEDAALAAADIKSLLRQRHRIQNPNEDPTKDDFVVRSAEQALSILSSVSIGLTLFLSAIAGISLVVGGIGIMNIMLVAVTERTREIGLRKAVGARKRDILLQFLVESVMLTVIGGAIGITGGVFLAFLIGGVAHRFLDGYVFALSWPAIGLAVGVSAGVGLLFGIYPAKRAADLNPIEALRFE